MFTLILVVQTTDSRTETLRFRGAGYTEVLTTLDAYQQAGTARTWMILSPSGAALEQGRVAFQAA